MAAKIPHIAVCICTFKRPQLLRQLLAKLDDVQTGGLFTYSAVVADNDRERSAEEVATAFTAAGRLRVTYCVEPQQNIALARNTALRNADGDMIAFIDDDEFPAADWLQHSFEALETYQAAGILGPVVPHFAPDAPPWIKKGRYFDRPRPATGYEIPYGEARTGNVLFRKELLDGIDNPFNPEFGTGGEDVDFFRRMTERGCRFFWCNEAVVYEEVPPSRSKLSYLLKRALLRGGNAAKHRTHRLRNAAKSLIAVPCYTLILPILALFGRHVFVDYLIKLCDHVARLLAYLGLKLATHREM